MPKYAYGTTFAPGELAQLLRDIAPGSHISEAQFKQGVGGGRMQKTTIQVHKGDIVYPDGIEGTYRYERMGPAWHYFEFQREGKELNRVHSSARLTETEPSRIQAEAQNKAEESFRLAIESEHQHYFCRASESDLRKKRPEMYQTKAEPAKVLAGKYALCCRETRVRDSEIFDTQAEVNAAYEERVAKHLPTDGLAIMCFNRLDRCWEIPRYNVLYGKYPHLRHDAPTPEIMAAVAEWQGRSAEVADPNEWGEADHYPQPDPDDDSGERGEAQRRDDIEADNAFIEDQKEMVAELEAEEEKAARGPEMSPMKKAADATDSKIAAKLTQIADRFQKDIDNGRRPMTQNPTWKREEEYKQRLREADHLERAQTIARRLVAMLESAEKSSLPVQIPARLSGQDLRELASPLLPPRAGERSYGEYKYEASSYVPRDGTDLWGMRTEGDIVRFREWYQGGADPKQNEVAVARSLEARERELCLRNIEGFFPTPLKLVETLLHFADIRPYMDVLEPSAGMGSIADEIRRQYPNSPLYCYEWNHSLHQLLKDKGHTLQGTDFLEAPGEVLYDRIISNPPFEKGADVKHVQKMYELLKPGGRLVSVMAPFEYQQTKSAFRLWLDEVDGYTYPNPDDAFSKGPRPINIRTVTVVINKPGG